MGYCILWLRAPPIPPNPPHLSSFRTPSPWMSWILGTSCLSPTSLPGEIAAGPSPCGYAYLDTPYRWVGLCMCQIQRRHDRRGAVQAISLCNNVVRGRIIIVPNVIAEFSQRLMLELHRACCTSSASDPQGYSLGTTPR